jgi:hypothetical protein
MNKEIRLVDEKKNLYQITCVSERWYSLPSSDSTTGLPKFVFLPSTTWITSCYPRGIQFYKWLADKGWDEAEAIKSAAGDKGSRVHQASERIESGFPVPLNQQFVAPSGEAKDLSVEEIDCLVSFVAWLDKTKPQILASEMTVVGDGYAGTIDRIYRIGKQIYIVDLKTSQYIWKEHLLQVSSYSHANIDYKALSITDEEWAARKMAILQVGYRKNKDNYKFTEIEDKYDMFLVAKQLWAEEHAGDKPTQKDYPLVLESKWVKEQNLPATASEKE